MTLYLQHKEEIVPLNSCSKSKKKQTKKLNEQLPLLCKGLEHSFRVHYQSQNEQNHIAVDVGVHQSFLQHNHPLWNLLTTGRLRLIAHPFDKSDKLPHAKVVVQLICGQTDSSNLETTASKLSTQRRTVEVEPVHILIQCRDTEGLRR